MNKTLHKKLTEKHFYGHTPSSAYPDGQDMRLLHEIAKDLLAPRPEAIAKLLEMAKNL